MKLATQKMLVLSLLLMPALAFAHSGHDHHSGFMAGLLHPVSGVDHLLAMLAVGLWATNFESKMRYAILAMFVLMMSAGFGMGVGGVGLPMMEEGIAVSVLVLGLAIALARKVPAFVAIGLSGLFALFHGAAHGLEMSGGVFSFASGFVLTSTVLLMTGLLVGLFAKNQMLHRVLGAVIGSVGLYLLFA